MNKKGFTLAELLAVITLLGVIALIAFPAVNSILDKSKDKAREVQVKNIINACQGYLSDVNNLDMIDKETTSYVTVNYLVRKGAISEDKVDDPKTGEPMNGCVEVTWNDETSRYSFNYLEDCCTGPTCEGEFYK